MKKIVLSFVLSILLTTVGFSQTACYLDVAGGSWGQQGISQAFSAVYGGNWTSYTYGSVTLETLFSSSHKVVFVEGGSSNTTTMKDFLGANWAIVSAWVSNGNTLIIDAASNDINGAYTISGSGVTSTRTLQPTMKAYTNSTMYPTTASTYCHPLLKDATYPSYSSGNYTGNFIAHNVITGTGLKPIFTAGDNSGYTMCEQVIGSGRIIWSGCTLPWYNPNMGWSPNTECQNLVKALISWATAVSSGASISTTTISSITTTTASSGGNITSDGGASVTERGVVWSTNSGPSISTFTGKATSGGGLGSFTISMSSLSANTTYYYRAYATNSTGTTYGNEYTFTTQPTNPSTASATLSPICNNGSSTSLSVTNGQGSVYWYSGSCGGTYVGIGNPLSVSPSSTTTYYARNYNSSGGFSSGCANTTVTVNQPASQPGSASVVVPLGITGQTQANLSWSQSTGLAPIDYYWAVGTGSGVTYESGSTSRGIVSDPTLIATATGLTKSTNYFLAVKAVNSCGPSAYRTSSSFKTNHELIYTAASNGTVGLSSIGGSASVTQTVSNSGSGVAVFAKPNTNYHFVNWSDGSTNNPRTDASVINSNSYTATFAINRLEFSVQPTNTIAGANIILTIRIRDVYGNTMTNSDQTVSLSIGTNPASGTLTGTTLTTVNGVASTSLSWINKVGTGYTLIATASPLTSATSSAFNITPAAIDHFTVEGITTPVVAGITTTPLVKAYDVYNNLKTNYVGTIHFTSTDLYPAVLPADYTFIPGNNGVKSFTNGVILKTTGTQSVTVTDIVDSKTGTQSGILVTPADINHWTLSTVGNVVAGSPFSVIATVYDQFGNIKTNYNGENSLSWSTTAMTSPNGNARIIPVNGNQTFTAGVSTIGGFTFFNSDQSQLTPFASPTITVTDGPTAIAGTTAPITVLNAPLDNFKVIAGTPITPYSTSAIAGTAFSTTATARDIYWNTCVDYVGNIRFKSSNDALVSFPPGLQPYIASNKGVRTFTNGILINTIGAYWLRAADAVYAYKSGQQENIIVEPGIFSKLVTKSTLEISDPTTPTTFVNPLYRIAGENVLVTLTPRDAQGNLLYSCRDISVLLNGQPSHLTGVQGNPLSTINVTDIGDGTYTALVRVTITGTNIISARFNSSNEIWDQTRTVIVAPAPVNLAHTLITANPTSMTTDQTSAILVQLKDEFDNNRITSGGTVTLTTDRGVLTGGVTDHNDGTYTANLYGNFGAVGLATITGTLAGDDILDNATVTINEGLATVATIEIIANPTAITTNETSLISVQLKDQFGNLVTTNAGTVTLNSPLGTLSAVTYANNGVYHSTLSGWMPGFGTTTITGTFNAVAIADDATVTFYEGLPDLAHISITASPTSITTDESSIITVQLKDIFGNLLSTSGGVVSLTTTIGALTAVTNNNNGTYTATLTGHYGPVGLATISGTLTGVVTGAISHTATVTITEGKPDLTTIDISPATATMTTDETRLITVRLKDQWGNLLTNSRGNITLITSVGALTSVTDNGNGTYTSTLSTMITGIATITGTLNDGADGVNGTISDDAVVTITDGKPNLAQIQITASPISITTDETSTITVQLKDQWGNNLTSQRGTIGLVSNYKGAISVATYQTSGYYTATLSGDNRGVGVTTIIGTLTDVADEVTGLINDNASVTITEGLPSLSVTDISVGTATITTDGSSLVTVQLKDQFGNLIANDRGVVSLTSSIGLLSSVSYAGGGSYTATLSGDTRGTNGTGLSAISGTFSGTGTAAGVSGSFTDGASVQINEGLPALATTLITANPITMTTDQTSTITVQLKDWLGNLITNDRSTVALNTNLGILTGGVAYSGAGIYTTTLHANNSGTGLATLTGTLAGEVIGAIGDNATVTITEGLPNLELSSLTAIPTTITTDGSSLVTLQLKDQFGNLLTTSRGTVTMTTTLGVLTSVTDNTNGTYTATLTANSSGIGTATITSSINGDVNGVFAHTATVTITEGLPNLLQSGILASPTTITTDQSSLITLRLKDQWGNLIIHSRGTVTMGTTLGVLTTVTDNNNGTYTATLTANATGTGIATISASINGDVIGAFSPTATVTITDGLPVLSRIEVTANPTAITADQTSAITVQLKDQWGNNLINSRGSITLLTSPIGHLSSVTDNLNGTYSATFSLIAYGTGTATITANFTGTGDASGVHGEVTDNATVLVSNGVATKLTMLTQPSTTATAGVNFVQQPRVRIEDQFGNLVINDNTTVLTAARSTGTDVLKGNLTTTASAGIGTFAGLYYTKAELINLGFTSSPALGTVTSTTILVGHAPIHHFELNAPADFIAGSTRAAYTVTRYDEFENLVTTGTQTAIISSSSTGANKRFYNAFTAGSLITQVVIANGASSANFWYYDEKTGNHTITASYSGVIDGTDQILVTPALLKDFLVYGVGNPHDLGTWQSATVEARDIFDNRKTDYTGKITFSNTDINAINPGDYQFITSDFGIHTFTSEVKFSQNGSWWLTALDWNEPTKYGAQANILVQRAVILATTDQSKTYGDVLNLGTTSFTVTDIVPGVTTAPYTINGQITATVLTSAGTAAIASVAGSPYDIISGTATGTFNPAYYRIVYSSIGKLTVYTRTLTLSNFLADGKVYDGTTDVYGPTVRFSDNRVNSDLLTFGYTATFTNKHKGTGKTVNYSAISISGGTGATNYNLGTTTATTTADIAVRPINVTAQTDSKVYDGNATSSVLPIVDPLQVGDLLTATGTQTYDTKHIGISKVLTPEGTVINDGNGGNNYAISYVNNETGIISTATITITAQTDTKVYDGTPTSTVLPIVSGIQPGDIATSTPTQSFDTRFVGTNKTLTPVGLTINDGNSGNNYTYSYITNENGVISTASVTVTAQTASKVYDGNTSSVVLPIVSGILLPDIATNTPTQTYDNRNVGSTKTLTASVLTINDGNNYTISYIPATGVISTATVTVTAQTDTKVYDGNTTSYVLPEVSGIISPDMATTTPTQTYDTRHAATNKTMTASGLTINDGNSGNNYTIAYVNNGSGVILTAPLTITANNQSKCYDATLVSPSNLFTTSTLISGETVSSVTLYSLGAEALSPVNTYSIVPSAAIGSGGFLASNYNINYVNGTLTVNPLPTASIEGTMAVCQNSMQPVISFTGANATAPYTFTYNINGGSDLTVTTTSVTSSVTVAVPTTVSGTYTYNLVSVQDASSTACLQSQTGSATITVNPLPTASISGTLAVCQNSTQPVVTFTGANGTTPYTFSYTINGGTTLTVTTNAGNSVTVEAPTTASGTFTYNLLGVQDASSTACFNSQTGSATITVNPLPTATISGTMSICQNSSQPVVTFTGAAGSLPYTFSYTINGGSTLTVTTNTGNSVTVAAPTTASGTFTYTLLGVQDASSTACFQAQSGSAIITVNPLPTATISGTMAVCQNSNQPLLSFTGAAGSSPYTFSYNINGGSTLTVTTITGNSVTIAAPTTTTGNFTYNLLGVRDASNTACFNAQTGSATITVNILPIPVLSSSDADNIICSTDAVSFTATGGVLYEFFVNAVSQGTASSTNTFTTNGLSNLQVVTVNVSNVFGCSVLSAGITTTVNPLPTPSIMGDLTACANTPNNIYSTTFVAGHTYEWIVSGGIITSGANTASVHVKWNNNCSNGWLQLKEIITATSCYVTTSQFMVTIYPEPTPVIIGNLIVTTNSPVFTYTTAEVTGDNYSWSVIGGTVINGQGSHSIDVIWGNCGNCTTGSVTVDETSVHGCTASSTVNITINITGSPVLSGNLTYDNATSTALNGVTVHLLNNSGIVVGTTTTVGINSSGNIVPGYYEFNNIPYGNYSVSVSSTKPWGGVTATDALLIKRHTVGLIDLSTQGLPYVAADVNASSTVNATDALIVQLRIVGLMNQFAAGDWKFNNTPFTFDASHLTYDFKGICVGDVNRSYYTTYLKQMMAASDGIQDIQSGKSFTYSIKANASAELGAMTLFMNYDPNLFEIEKVNNTLDGLQYKVENGEIAFAWADLKAMNVLAGETIISLQIKARTNITLPTQIFNSTMNSEFADANAVILNHFGLKMADVQTSKANSFGVDVYPNPAREITNIVYALPEQAKVKIVLTNILGQAIHTIVDAEQTEGNYKITVNATDLNLFSGVYMYQIEVNGITTHYSKIGKIVFER